MNSFRLGMQIMFYAGNFFSVFFKCFLIFKPLAKNSLQTQLLFLFVCIALTWIQWILE